MKHALYIFPNLTEQHDLQPILIKPKTYGLNRIIWTMKESKILSQRYVSQRFFFFFIVYNFQPMKILQDGGYEELYLNIILVLTSNNYYSGSHILFVL